MTQLVAYFGGWQELGGAIGFVVLVAETIICMGMFE